MSNPIEKLSNPTHLAMTDTEQLREAAEKAAIPAPAPKADPDDPKLRDVYPFDFDWTDSRGRRWAGSFTNKILTIAQRGAAGLMRAQLAGGLPMASLDEMTREINLMIAHMEFSLGTERPDWAKDLRSLKDTRILYRLYEEVASHEATFFGWDEPEASGTASV
jgi:hypothetical protein